MNRRTFLTSAAASIAVGGLIALGIGPLSAQQREAVAAAADNGEYDWTVVTMARNGSWGAATDVSLSRAISASIRGCGAMSAEESDCGAQHVATRNGWILANLCGDEKVIVAAETLEEAEQTAPYREIDLQLFYVQHLPPCRRVLTVDPQGAVTRANTQYSGRP